MTPLVHARLFVRSPPPQVENVKEVLQLSAEQKGALVPVGELTVLLNKLSTAAAQEELAALTNGNAANGTSEFTKSHRPKCYFAMEDTFAIRYLKTFFLLLLLIVLPLFQKSSTTVMPSMKTGTRLRPRQGLPTGRIATSASAVWRFDFLRNNFCYRGGREQNA